MPEYTCYLLELATKLRRQSEQLCTGDPESRYADALGNEQYFVIAAHTAKPGLLANTIPLSRRERP